MKKSIKSVGLISSINKYSDELYDEIIETLENSDDGMSVDIANGYAIEIEINYPADEYEDGDITVSLLTYDDTVVYSSTFSYKHGLSEETIKNVIKQFVNEITTFFSSSIKKAFGIF